LIDGVLQRCEIMSESSSAQLQSEIRECLLSLVESMSTANGAAMIAGMERLDRFVSADGASLPPRLMHFLENRSYAKALDFLGGSGEVPRGSCQPRNG
jgi:hypothetical protein